MRNLWKHSAYSKRKHVQINLWFPKQRKNLLRKIRATRQDTTPPQRLWRIRKVRTQVVISRQPLRWNETRGRLAPPLFVFYTKNETWNTQLHLALLQHSRKCPKSITRYVTPQRQPLSSPNGNFSRRSLTNNSDKNCFLSTYVNSDCIYRRTNKQKQNSDLRHFMQTEPTAELYHNICVYFMRLVCKPLSEESMNDVTSFSVKLWVAARKFASQSKWFQS